MSSEGVCFLFCDVQKCSSLSRKKCTIYRYTKKEMLVNQSHGLRMTAKAEIGQRGRGGFNISPLSSSFPIYGISDKSSSLVATSC